MNASAITWKGPLSQQEVAQQLTQALFGPRRTLQLPKETLRAEILRVATWEQCALQPSLANARVSTHKILRRARALWQPIAPDFRGGDSPGEEILSRQVLEALAEQGDLLSLSKGEWLPAPLRLVPISPERYLLAGGIPASLLASSIFQGLHLHGSFRQLDAHLIQKRQPFDSRDEAWPFQTLDSWLGTEPPSFTALLQQFRDAELAPQTTQYTAEVYVPSSNQPQRRRWLTLEKVPRVNGRYLLRSQRLWGQRSYTIGLLEQGRVTHQGQFLESWDIPRLRYALDNEAHKPTQAMWKRREGELILHSELPAHERKRFAVLGTLQSNGTEYYYPRIWRFSLQYESEVKSILQELSVSIQEVS